MWLWQMPIKIVFSTKRFQTNFTNVRTFSSMSEDVSNHVNLLLGLFGTKWAPKSINIKLNRIILQNRRKRAMFRIGIFICWQFFFNLIVQNWRVLLLHMPGEWIFPTKTGMAHWALMRFFPSMYQNMPFQISDVFGFHNHITKRTLIFVWIQKHRSKILQFHEKVLFLLDCCMKFQYMIFQMIFARKCLRTIFTNVWFDPSVNSDMPTHISWIFALHCEAAERALKNHNLTAKFFRTQNYWFNLKRSSDMNQRVIRRLHFYSNFKGWTFKTWLFQLSCRAKALEQSWQTKGFSPVWVIMCLSIFCADLLSIILLQIGHW